MKNSTVGSYAALLAVISVWGITPIFNKFIYNYYSPTVCSTVSSLVALVGMLLISVGQLKSFNKDYLRIALPTGLCNAVASLLQKIGLEHTTPSSYAFLENLSCVAVPILAFIFFKRRPAPMKLVAGVVCLVGCLVLSGLGADGFSLGIGDILCAAAGLLYSVNITVTGVYAERFVARLYVLVHMAVQLPVSLAATLILDVMLGGAEMAPASLEIWPLVAIAAMTLISNVLCWTLRTSAMKRVDPTAVAVIMPLSAVVSGALSVLAGMEELTASLVLGGSVCLVAAALSGLSDVKTAKNATRVPRFDKETVQIPGNSTSGDGPNQI